MTRRNERERYGAAPAVALAAVGILAALATLAAVVALAGGGAAGPELVAGLGLVALLAAACCLVGGADLRDVRPVRRACRATSVRTVPRQADPDTAGRPRPRAPGAAQPLPRTA